MDSSDDGCAFSNGGANPFNGAGTDISHCEDAALARLKGQGPIGSAARFDICVWHRRAGLNEPLFVERNAAALKPAGRRIGADHDENVMDILLGFSSCWLVAPSNAVE